MVNAKVTNLENQVLMAVVDGMYAEWGFSDYSMNELTEDTNISPNVLRGVVGSLVKKGFLNIQDANEHCTQSQSMHIIYLWGCMDALVTEWREEEDLEEVNLVII
mgnify:FL=1